MTIVLQSQMLSPPCTSPRTPILILLQANTAPPDTHILGLRTHTGLFKGTPSSIAKARKDVVTGQEGEVRKRPAEGRAAERWSHPVSGQRCWRSTRWQVWRPSLCVPFYTVELVLSHGSLTFKFRTHFYRERIRISLWLSRFPINSQMPHSYKPESYVVNMSLLHSPERSTTRQGA